MPGAIRPNEKTAKIIYKIKNTPKQLQQNFKDKDDLTEKRLKLWKKDSEVQR